MLTIVLVGQFLCSLVDWFKSTYCRNWLESVFSRRMNPSFFFPMIMIFCILTSSTTRWNKRSLVVVRTVSHLIPLDVQCTPHSTDDRADDSLLICTLTCVDDSLLLQRFCHDLTVILIRLQSALRDRRIQSTPSWSYFVSIIFTCNDLDPIVIMTLLSSLWFSTTSQLSISGLDVTSWSSSSFTTVFFFRTLSSHYESSSSFRDFTDLRPVRTQCN